jgi:hypothetical protein
MVSYPEVSDEIIDEILGQIFQNKTGDIRTTYRIPYNSSRLSHRRIGKVKQFLPDTVRGVNCSSRITNQREHLPNQIKNKHIGNHCNFCGEVGHYKKTCLKKQIFDSQKRPNVPTSITFEPEFLKIAKLLRSLQINPISVPELLQLRTIIDTLIYYNPSNKNIHYKSSN